MTQEGYAHAYRQGFIKTVRVLRAQGASLDNAEDVAQAAWCRGWQKLDQLREDGTIAAWVNTIAVNYYRRGCRYETRYQPLSEIYGDIGIDVAPLDAAKVLKFCRPADRMLFEYQLHGSTTREIANTLGVSTTAIRIRLSRARRAVRETFAGRLARTA